MKLNCFIWFFLIIKKIIFIYTETINNIECPRETPLLDKNANNCTYIAFNEDIYEISNSIIKIQWLNKRNQIGPIKTWFIGSDFSSKGDLLIESIVFDGGNLIFERIYYGIRNNGRALFYDIENGFTNEISINSTSNVNKFESEFFKIKLINNDDKDYFLSPCFEDFTIDIIDFYNKRIIGIPQTYIFGDILITSKMYSIFELAKAPKTYLFCFIGNYSYISFQKFNFKNFDISQENSYEKLLSSNLNDKLKVQYSLLITCIEITKYDLIQCLYVNTTNYLTIGLFNEDSFEFIQSEIIDDTEFFSEPEFLETFYQCIHLKNEISILGYFLNSTAHDDIYIQIKKISYNNYYSKYEIEDYLISFKKIIIKLEGIIDFDTYYYLNHLKKINDNKFSLISSSQDLFQLYVFIFDLYNFHDTNLFIRYYCIQLKLYDYNIYRYLRSITFNGFLGLIYTINIGSDSRYQYFSLFSYINGTDSELTSLGDSAFFKLSNYINEDNIENNIFGVDLYGIKILKLPNSNRIGVYYFSKSKRNIIFENDILSTDDEIYFIFDNDILQTTEEIYTIEIAGVVKEKLYNDSIKFTIHNEYYGKESPESFYQPKIKIGTTIFYNFTIDNRPIVNYVNNCNENCKICYNSICIKCKNNYKLIIGESNDCQTTISNNNYYYEEIYNVYKQCHENCKTCLRGPIYYNDSLEIEDTNCDVCIDNYFKMENTNNCVNINNPPERYFFDTEQNVFIKCHENCKTCSQSPINSTYFNCLSCDDNSILYQESTNCLNFFARNKYINYYRNDCIEYIPEGYYLDNETKIIEKCYYSCKNCNSKGDSNDHKCLECAEGFIYKNKEETKCIDDCLKEYVYLDLETRICYNDCNENLVTERKYNFNHTCKREEDKPDNYEISGNNFVSICFFFNNECYYNDCPEGTKLNNSITSQHVCICNYLYYINEDQLICINSSNCPEEYPFLKDNNTLECAKCIFKYKDKCVSSCPENTYINQINENLKICIDITNDNQNDDSFFKFSTILDKIENLNNKNNIVITDYPNVTINVYINGIIIDEIIKAFPNLTFINLDKCGDELKHYYNLNADEILYIASFESSNKITNRVTNEFYFEVYLKNGTQLKNLSICSFLNISVSSSISKLDKVNYNEAEILNTQGYNIYNLSSEFYIDKCSGADINGNDITLKDRIEYIYPNNISFCSNKCDLKKVEIESKRVNCSCNIYYNEEPLDLSNNIEKLKATENFINYLLDNINYKIFKCSYILLKTDMKNLISNVGFFLGSGVILFTLINSFIFFFSYLPKIRIKIFKFIPNNKKLKNKFCIIKRNLEKVNNNKKPSVSTPKNNYIIITKGKTNLPINPVKKKAYISNLLNKKEKSENKKEKSSNKKEKSENKKEKSSNKKEKNNNKKEKSNNKKKEDEFNCLPYTKALKLDRRNIISIYLSIIKMKIDIIQILFYSGEFVHKSITLSLYMLEFLFSFFMNAFLYTDDIVSEKYHNNGQLDIFTSLGLSLTANIASSILIYYIKKLVSYREYLTIMVKEINRKFAYILIFQKLYKCLKIQVFLFFFVSLILSSFMMIYILTFCQIYKNSQNSFLINHLIGLTQSLAYSVGISFIISVLRFIGLKLKIIYLYRTSVYLYEKL